MSPERLFSIADSVVRQTLSELPPDIRHAAKGCLIEPALMHETDMDEQEGLGDDLLGLFEGCSLQDGLPEAADQLPRIRLFVDNLWDYSGGDSQLFRAEVRVTFLHELGHYLGLNEAQVENLGLA